MSIVLAQTTRPQELLDAFGVLFFTVGPLVSFFIAYRAGAFQREALRSPDRIGADEHPGTLGSILLAALACWISVLGIYGSMLRGPATTQPATLSMSQEVKLNIVMSGCALFVLLVGNAVQRPGGLQRLGLGVRRLPRAIVLGIAGVIFVLPVIAWVSVITELAWKWLHIEHPAKHEMLRILDRSHSLGLKVLIVFSATILAPVFEELLFRGHIQTLLRHYMRSAWPAIILAAAAFAMVHPGWTRPPIFALALCLGWVYERTGNLWVSMTIHALFNATSITYSLASG